jgi:hypothetical protein
MGRARHSQALTLVLGLSLGMPCAVDAQTSGMTWQSTPASVLKHSLRSVVAAQDKYRASHPIFAGTVDALQLNPGHEVKIQILSVTANSWRAKATHRARPGRSCVVFVGALTGAELPKTDADGEVAGEERVPLCDRME